MTHVCQGMRGSVKRMDGDCYEGYVRHVSAEGESKSRTFDVELDVLNPQLKISAGISADIRFPTEKVMVHKLSLALLSWNDARALGVKVVDENNIVHFGPAKIAKSSTKAIWLTDLPDSIRLTAADQGFAQVVEHVIVASDEHKSTSGDSEK